MKVFIYSVAIAAVIAAVFVQSQRAPDEVLPPPEAPATCPVPDRSVLVTADLAALRAADQTAQHDIANLRGMLELLRVAQACAAPTDHAQSTQLTDALRRIDELEKQVAADRVQIEKLAARRECACPTPATKPADASPALLVPPESGLIAAGQAEARHTNRKLLVLFTQDGANCSSCRKLTEVLADPACLATIERKYVLVEVRVDQDFDTSRQHKIRRTPSGKVYDPAADSWGSVFIVPQTVSDLLAKLCPPPAVVRSPISNDSPPPPRLLRGR